MGRLVAAAPDGLIAMLDVEFLQDPPAIDRHIIYRYRSGWLKPHVTTVLQKQAATLGLQFAMYPVHDGRALAGGLFAHEELQACEWGSPSLPKQRREIFSRLVAWRGNPTAHFIPAGSPADAFDWKDIKARCLVVEEPLVGAENVDLYLQFYISQTDLAVSMEQLERSGFISRFKHANNEVGCDLAGFIRDLELHVLKCVDPVTGVVDFDDLAAEQDQQPLSLRPRLRRFLETGDTRDLVRFVTTSARRAHRECWTSIELVSELYRVTLALFPDTTIETARDGNPVLRLRRADLVWRRRLVIWAITLMVWEARLTHHAVASRTNFMRAPDPFIGVLDQMCRNFMANDLRDRAAESREPDFWRHGNEALALAVKESALAIPSRRTTLVRQVVSVAETLPQLPWLREIIEGAADAVQAMAPPKVRRGSAAQSS